MKRKEKRLLSICLAAILTVTQLPVVAMAENSVPEDKVNFAEGEREDALGHGAIASFEPLDSGVKKQTVTVGTELSELTLPDTVTAAIYHVTEDTVIPDKVNGGEADKEGGLGHEDNTEDDRGDASIASPSDADESVSGNHAGDSSDKDNGETVTTVTTTRSEIPVTWDSEPAYDGDTEGKYVFTADVSGYVLSSSAKLPRITVTVSADTVQNPTEKPTGEPLPCTLTEGCTLENGHEGECVQAPPVNDGLVKTVTGWTFVDDENLNEGELVLPGVSTDNQADFDTVVSMLPTQISAEIDGETEPATLDITGWSCTEYVQDGDDNWPVTGEYIFTAVLPDGYACDLLPTVKVLLGGANTFAANNTVEQGGIKIAASDNGEVVYTDGSGFTLNESGTYEISGEWGGMLNDVDSGNRKAVITVPDGVTANVTLSGVKINVSNTDYACAFAVAAGGTANITLSDTNTLSSTFGRAGLEVPENAAVTIAGDGSLEANGDRGAGIGGGSGPGGTITINGGTVEANGNSGAGIGGGSGSGGTITINGGTVTATGGNGGAGIGGSDGPGGTIIINGGTVEANGGYGGAGIGGGGGNRSNGGPGGTIEISGGTVTASSDSGAGIGGGYGNGDSGGGEGTWGGDGGLITIDGNAVVFATSNQAAHIGGGPGGSDGTKTLTEGVVFEGSGGTVHGSPELPGDITIPDGSTLTVPNGSTLIIPDNTAITNNGQITNDGRIENHGTVSGAGTLENNGTVNDQSGGISVTVTGTNAVNKPSEISITFWKDGKEITDGKTVIGGTITVQANVAQKHTRLQTITPNQVVFKAGTTELGTVNVLNGTATLSLSLAESIWTPGSYTITAEYSGGTDLLPGSSGSAILIVEAPSYTDPSSGGSSSSGSGKSAYTNPDILYGTWVQADTGVWMFRQTGGSYVRNRWGKADGLWYYFDSDGKMLTGWQWLGNQWYYLHTEETARTKAGMKEGAMASGWHFDPGYQKWFYLDAGGAMVTGWREIDGKWYYFNPEPDGQRGIMYTDDWIDGWYVDKNGVWDREAKKEK